MNMGDCWVIRELCERQILPPREQQRFQQPAGISGLHSWIAPGFHKITKEEPKWDRSLCWTQHPTTPNPLSWCFPSPPSPSHEEVCVHTEFWGKLSGQGGAGAAKWWFLSELGSVCTYYRYSSSLLCFQLGVCSSRWFSCMLKSLAVCGQAEGFIYQLEAPAGSSCISHSAVLGSIPQIYSF